MNNEELTTIVLEVNGQKASATLKELEQQAVELGRKIEEARTKGENTKKLESQLKSVNKQMKDIESSTRTVERTMKAMDKAAPKELKATLKQLENELNYIKRGSKTWDAHVAAIRKVRQELERVKKETGATQTGFAKFASGMKSMFSAMFNPVTLAISAIAAIGKVIKDTIAKNKEFEQANANLAAVLGTTRSEVSELTVQAKQLGATTMFTASQVTELQTELAKLGFSKKEILASSDAVLKLSAATGAGLGEAAALAGAALRAFNLDATEMERVTSVLAVSTSKSALSFDKLATALPIVSPVAKQFGFTIEDTVTLLGKLSDAGFDASSAATATRNIFLNMANSSGSLAKALGRPIKSIEDLAPALVELKNKGIDLATMLELTDKRSVAAFATFIDSADKLQPLKDSITDCSEALDGMVNEQMNTLEGSSKILASAWEGLMLSFSGSNGILKKTTDALANLLTAWTNWRNRNNGGDQAIATYEQGVTKEVKESLDLQVKKAKESGKTNEDIISYNQEQLEQLEKERDIIREEYDLWQKRHDLIKKGKQGIAANSEEFASIKGVTNEMSVGRDYAQRIAKYNDRIAQRNYVVNSLSPDEPTTTTSGNQSSNNSGKSSADSWKAKQEALAKVAYVKGESQYEQYTQRLLEIEVEYQTRKLSEAKEGSDEYYKAMAAKSDAEIKLTKDKNDRQKALDKQAIQDAIQAENTRYEDTLDILQTRYFNGEISAKQYQTSMELLELEHLRNIKELYQEGSKEQLQAEKAYQKASLTQQRKHAEDAQRLRDNLQKQFFSQLKSPNSEEYADSKLALDQLYQELSVQATTNEQKLELERKFHEARYLLAKEYNDKIGMEQIDSTRKLGDDFTESITKMGDGLSAVWNQVSQLIGATSNLVSAETELQTAKIESKYDAEIEAAGKNEKLVAQLEKKKADEIAAVKSAAAKKQFAMDVISAVAEGIMSAISAWNAGWQMGAAGVVMAPLFMALSLATTGVQIAALKKQQQAAEATGYAKGRKGGKAEFALIGEKGPEMMYIPDGASIVPNNKLQSPQDWGQYGVPTAFSPLDEVRRTNTIGTIGRRDVSRSITAQQVIAETTSGGSLQAGMAAQVASNSETAKTLERLNKRLDEPLVAVTTITGDKGIKRAQDKYDKLIRNKSVR